jgi:DNA-binding NtrC family response regulator
MSAFLIVDEDRNFREALAIALRLDGHDALVASAVEEACVRLRAVRFDCCVVDAHMAGADTALEAAAGAGARVVAIGPYPELLVPVAKRHHGATTLAKPFRVSDLMRLVPARARAVSG